MNQKIVRAVALAVLVLAGFLVYRVLFPSPELIIRGKLKELANVASVTVAEGELARVANAGKVVSYFTPEVVIAVDIPGRSQHVLKGRDDLFQAAVMVRGMGTMTIEFPDINVTVAPDKETAVVDLTAKARIPGDANFYVQEMKLVWKRVGRRDWLIERVETVKTLM